MSYISTLINMHTLSFTVLKLCLCLNIINYKNTGKSFMNFCKLPMESSSPLATCFLAYRSSVPHYSPQHSVPSSIKWIQ